MKRSDFYIKVITAVLFIAVVCYIGVYIYNAVANTYETVTALNYTVEQTIPTEGFIIRTETVIEDSNQMSLPIVGEGEKVASGQAVAVEYFSREALETAGEIRALRLIIAELESNEGEETAESARFSSVTELSKAVQRGDFSRIDELIVSVEANIFIGATLTNDLPAIKARLAALEARETGQRTVYAPVSGTFSSNVDGFEHVNPTAVSDIIPFELTSIFSSPTKTAGSCKLVTEFKWYYATIMDAADASRLTAGRQVNVQFTGAYHESMELYIEKIGRKENDECVVLFSCNRFVHEITPMRQLRAEVVVAVISGIRVPKEAIYLDDNGKTFIYIQTGVRAERVDVEILIESGDSYLVRDGAQTGSPLRAGSAIISKANNIFDGKLVGSN